MLFCIMQFSVNSLITAGPYCSRDAASDDVMTLGNECSITQSEPKMQVAQNKSRYHESDRPHDNGEKQISKTEKAR